jgi:hypothetical protein
LTSVNRRKLVGKSLTKLGRSRFHIVTVRTAPGGVRIWERCDRTARSNGDVECAQVAVTSGL